MLASRMFKISRSPLIRGFAEAASPKGKTHTHAPGTKHKVVLFPGHGIGPEITSSVLKIFDALKIPIEWEEHYVQPKVINKEGDLILPETLDAIKKYRYALKGPFTTPVGKGYRSINVTLRKKLNLFANVRPCKTIKGIKSTVYDNVDVVTLRENTEGEYSGLEHEVVPGVVENLKIITRPACENIAKYAFEYARMLGRKNITCVHKEGIMVKGDGCFVNTCREYAKKYPEINYSENQIDTLCLKLVQNPEQLDVMVMPNLYGDIVSDLCAGLIGGLGLTASGNIGFDCEVYEAVHGSAPDIAGKNMANPTALLLSACMMLDAMGHRSEADRIRNSIYKVIQEGKYITGDIGGKAGTLEYTKALIDNL